MIRLPAWLLLLLAAPSTAQTLEPPGSLGQITATAAAAEDARASQIAPGGRSVAAANAAGAPSAAPSPQLAQPRDGAPPTQLVREKRTGAGTVQLSDAPPSARPPAPLSRPADGRTAATDRIGGRDRCDPAATRSAACSVVIETRAADFPPPSAEPLSPEQRLLVEQRLIGERTSPAEGIARTATRRVGRDGADAAAADMQGLASVVLGTTALAPPPKDEPTSGLSAEQAAAATSVLGALNGPRP